MDKGRAALVALVLQNTLLVLTMRYSRTRPGPMYLASTAVIVDEVRSMPPGLGCSHPRSVAALAQPATNPCLNSHWCAVCSRAQPWRGMVAGA